MVRNGFETNAAQFHYVQLTKTSTELCGHFVQMSTVLFRVKSILVTDGLWYFVQVGKVCQPSTFQTLSLPLNAFTALIIWGRCRSFPWSSLFSAFSFAVRSVRKPRSSNHPSSDSSSCPSFLGDRKVLIAAPLYHDLTTGHRHWELGHRTRHRAHPETPWKCGAGESS